MRRITLATLALTVGVFATAADPESGGDAGRLQGEWVMVSLEINGEGAREDQIATARLTVEGDRYTPRYEEKYIQERFKIHADQSPRGIDFTYTDGPRKGETVKGIYKIEGDRYTMCRPLLAEDARPTRFVSSPDSGLALVVWKRDSAEERARRKAIADERKRFDGLWVGEFNQRDGTIIPESEAKQARLIVTGDRYTMERGGDRTSRGTSKLDPSRTPKTMDINIIDGVNKGQTWLGIYELTSDTYRTCFATDGKTRPNAFTSEPGSGNILWVFRRAKE